MPDGCSIECTVTVVCVRVQGLHESRLKDYRQAECAMTGDLRRSHLKVAADRDASSSVREAMFSTMAKAVGYSSKSIICRNSIGRWQKACEQRRVDVNFL